MPEAQQRTEERLTALTEAQQHTEERLTALTEAQQHTEERLTALTEAQQRTEERLTALTEAQQRTEERLVALTEALQALTHRVDGLGRSVNLLHDDASKLKGYALESRYRSHAPPYFSAMARRTHVMSLEELQALLEEAIEQDRLAEADTQEILLADLVVRGRRREDNAEVYLVVEVSWVVDPYDIERAVRRSSLLGKMGTPTLAVVAGETVLEEAASLANRLLVWQVTNGHVVPPQNGASQSA